MINLKMDALMVSASIMFLSYFTIRCCSIIWIGCCTDHLIDQGPTTDIQTQTPKPILQPIRVELRCPYPIEVTVVRTPLPEIKSKPSPTYDDPC